MKFHLKTDLYLQAIKKFNRFQILNSSHNQLPHPTNKYLGTLFTSLQQNQYRGKGKNMDHSICEDQFTCTYLHCRSDTHGSILFRTSKLAYILVKPEYKPRRMMQYMIVLLHKSIRNLYTQTYRTQSISTAQSKTN